MNIIGREWTTAERRIVADGRAKGQTVQQIADRLQGRSVKAVYNFLYRHGITKARKNFTPKAKIDPRAAATGRLGAAINESIARFANDNGLSEDDAKALLLGGQMVKPIPGTERHLKTCAVERLAA